MADITPNNEFENLLNQYELGKLNVKPLTNADWSQQSSFGGAMSTEQAAAIMNSLSSRILNTQQDRRLATPISPNEIDTSGRYPKQIIGFDNEELYAQGQSWGSKMVHGVLKGTALAATTFLQGTVGLVNGVAAAINDGRLASFYDNDFNNALDQFNKELENRYLPNYYTKKETNAAWYSPDNLFTANFLWDKIVKNLGFAGGAALSGMAYSAALRAIPLTARLFSTGRAAEILAAQEEAIAAGKAFDSLGKIRSLSDNFLNSYKLLNAGGRATVAGLSTIGEASFEALQNLNEFRDSLVQDYTNTYGIAPTGEALDKINQAADKVGNWTFGLNTALLTATNYVQFPKILGSSQRLEKGIYNDLAQKTKGIIKNEAGEFVQKTSSSRILSTLNKIRPYLFSTSEGFEEGAQFAIQLGTEHYWNKAYENAGNSDLWEAISSSIGQTVNSKEGLESILIGGLSGSLMMARGRMKENKELQGNTQQAISRFNQRKLSDFTSDTLDSLNRGAALSEEKEKAVQAGDVLQAKDLEKDYILNYLTPRIKYGRYDLVKQDIADMKALASTQEGFAQLQAEGKALPNDTQAAFLSRISQLETTASHVASLYQSLNLRYSGLIDEKGERVYAPETIDKMVYAASKVADYDSRIPQLSSRLLENNISIQDIVEDVAEKGVVNEEKKEGILGQIGKIVGISNDGQEIKEELRQNLDDVLELTARRRKFLREYQDMVKNPDRYSTILNEKGEAVTKTGLKKRTTIPDAEVDSYRPKLPSDERNHEQLIQQYGQGEKSQKEVLNKILDSEYATKAEKELAQKLLTLTKPEDTLTIGNTSIPFAGTHLNGKIDINTEASSKDYEAGTSPIEAVILSQIAKKYPFLSGDIKRSQEISKEDIQKEQEELDTAREAISKLTLEQKGLQVTSGTVITPVPNTLEIIPQESSKKHINRLFGSTTANNERYKEHQIKEQLFLQNNNFHKNRANQKVMLVTANNEEAFGLKGLTAYLTRGTSIKPTDTYEGPVAAVYVVQENGKYFYLNERGEKLGTPKKQEASKQENVEEGLLKFSSSGKTNIIFDRKSHKFIFQTQTGKELTVKQSKRIARKITGHYFKNWYREFSTPQQREEIRNLEQEMMDLLREARDIQAEDNLKLYLMRRIAGMKFTPAILSDLTDVSVKKWTASKDEGGYPLDTFVTDILGVGDEGSEIEQEGFTGYDEQDIMNEIKSIIQQYPNGISKRDIKNEENDNNPLFKLEELEERFLELTGLDLNISIELYNDVKDEKTESADSGEAKISVPDKQNQSGGREEEEANQPEYFEVGNPVDFNQIVFGTLTTPSLHWSKEYGNDFRYSGADQETAEAYSRQWQKRREEIFSLKDSTEYYSFNISRGIGERNPPKDGKYERNPIVSTLVPIANKDVLDKVQDLVQVSTTGSIEHNGELINIPVGKAVFKYGSTLEFLDNRNFTEEEATAIFEVLKKATQEVLDKKGFAEQWRNYLQGLLYFGRPTNTDGSPKPLVANNVFFEGPNWHFGRKTDTEAQHIIPFSPQALERNRDTIIAFLKDTYNNVNNHKLTQLKGVPFEEITGFNEDGTPQTIKWKSYQHYLIQDKTPGGKPRFVPLATSIKQLQNEEDRNYKYKYAWAPDVLGNVDAQPTLAPKEEAKTLPVSSSQTENKPVINGYTLDGVTKNTFKGKNGDVPFTATLNSGAISVSADVPKEVIDKIASNSQAVQNVILPAVKAIDPSITDEREAIASYVTNSITITLQQQYDKEQAAKEDEKPLVVQPEPDLQKRAQERINKAKEQQDDDSAFRTVVGGDFIAGNIEKEKGWIEQRVGVPVHIVSNIIEKLNGGYAWGKLQDKAITLYSGAEQGTGYHEAFEAVWGLFTKDSDKTKHLKEFRSRQGRFVDYETGKQLKYSEATDYQAKEQLAEEFREYVLFGRLPERPKGATNFIKRFFQNLKQWIEKLFFGKARDIEELFRRIDAGYYKQAPFVSLTQNAEYRSIPGLDSADTYNIIRGTAAKIFQKFAQNGGSFTEFDGGFPPLNTLFDEVFDQLQKDFDKGIKEGKNHLAITAIRVEDNKELIKQLTIQYLRSFNLVIPQEEDERESEDSNYASGNDEGYLIDSFKWDGKRNAPASIRLLFATIAETIFDPSTGNGIRSLRDEATYMERMIESGRMFNQTLHEISGINSIKEKEARLQELAKQYPNYVRLINRLKLNLGDEALKDEDIQLRVKLFNTFSKQRPIALKIVKEEGKTYLREANSSDAQARLKTDWVDSLKDSPLVSFSTEENVYKINAANLPEKIKSTEQQVKLLNQLSIPFTADMLQKLSDSERSSFARAAGAIHAVLTTKKETPASSVRSLGLESSYRTLAALYVKATGELPESTFLSIEGTRRQEFIQNNTISTWINDINSASSLEDLYEVLPHLNTTFARGSNYITEEALGKEAPVFQIEYIEGIDDIDNDRVSTVDRMSEAQRLQQEINANLQGHYYILLPADSKTEWMVKTSPLISYTEMSQEGLWERVQGIFNGYYTIEKELHTLDGKDRLLHVINGGYAKDQLSQAELKEFFNSLVLEQKEFLEKYNIITTNSNGTFKMEGLDTDFASTHKINAEELTRQQLYNVLLFRTLNYAVNNIELQKIFFGDPAAYGSLDNMLKRYKSFLSPRETSLHSWDHFNSFANTEYNVSGTEQLEEGDFGYHTYKDHMDTITLESVIVATQSITEDERLPGTTRDAYKKGDSTDAQSWATLPGYREIRQKRGFDWKKADEQQYQYNMARDRQEMLEDGLLDDNTYRKALQEADKKILQKGNPRSGVFQVLKPVGSGYTLDNNPFLDKTSVLPYTYHTVRGTNLAPHYAAMVKQGISYAIVDSGRKVGAKDAHSFYTEQGQPNTEYSSVVRIPFRYFGIQTETGGTSDNGTIGSQVSKLVELNIYQNGVPSDYSGTTEEWFALTPEQRIQASPRHAAVIHAEAIRKEMVKNGYTQLLKKLGIEETEEGTEVNLQQIEELLKDELFRREVADNIRGALSINPETGMWTVPLEALNNYSQIRSIIYSYINKHIAKPKVNGGPKVQVSSAGFEVAGHKVTVGKDSKGRPVYVSSSLKFYERKDGSVSRMEVLLPSWFMKKFPRKTEQEVMDIVNSSPDKADILSGVGFRIPTQEMNSVEAFTVKGFLPAEHGDTIVVPEGITTKAGSDFDVDKLNTYLKNVYTDVHGQLFVVPHFESREKSDEFFSSLFDKKLQKTKEKKAELLEAVQNLAYGLEDKNNLVRRYGNLLDTLLEDLNDTSELEDKLMKELEKLGDADRQQELKEAFLDRMYTQSLENEYFRSLENLILHPDNFERLVKPNSADKLKAVATTLTEQAPSEFGAQSTPSTLSPLFMSRMRHDFILSKGWVGIVAVHNTNNVLNQKAGTFIDPKRLQNLTDLEERAALGDGAILLPHNTITISGTVFPTLAGGKDQEGEYISDGLSEVLDGAVDAAKGAWLSKIIQNTDTLPVYLTLRQLGVPRETAAYFINQPIIREYQKLWAQRGREEYKDAVLEKLEKLFGRQKDKAQGYGVDTSKPKAFPNHLLDKITGFYKNGKLSREQNQEQWFILDEFFKYEAMAKNLRRFIQGTSYDTANFSDPNILELKEYQTRDAQTNNIFSSVNNILRSSFIGEIKDTLRKGTNIVSSTVFTFDHPENRRYIAGTLNQLKGYIKGQDRYINAAKNAERSFIQYLIQVSTGLNNRLPELLKNKETAITTQLQQLKLKGDIANNLIIKSLKQSLGNTPTSTKNLSLFSRAFDVFTSNQYTAALRELKDNPHTQDFYNSLLDAAFLQAGISTQFNSFADIIPNEDFAEKINSAIQALTNPDLLKTFEQTDAFFRNNWHNTDIVPRIKEKWGETQDGFYRVKNIIAPSWLKKAGIPFGYKVDTRSRAFNAPYVTLLRDKPGFTSDQKKAMRAKGDYSYKEILLLRRFTDEQGTPILHHHNEKSPQYGQYAVFYPVNALGDAQRAQEYYTATKPSILENNTYRPEKEVSNKELLDSYRNQNSGSNGQNVPEIRNSQFANQELEQGSLFSNNIEVEPLKDITTAVNHSGGAVGADSAWDEIGKEFGMVNNRHYYAQGEKTPKGNVPISKKELKRADPFLKEANKTLKRKFPSSNEFVNNLLRRNYWQVDNSDAVFAISTITDNKVNGGTGWAVHMGIAMNKPVYVFDQNKKQWLTWSDGQFVVTNIPTLTQNFAGIGTREINEAGKQAIREVYKKSVEPSNKQSSLFQVDQEKRINIYAGSNENKILSNMAIRPFILGADEYNSVEQYYQDQKRHYTKDDISQSDFEHNGRISDKIMASKNPFEVKRLGRMFKAIDTGAWDRAAAVEMKKAIKASFEQNPDALKALLATGNALLTHNQESGRWKTDFPRLLMEVRSELKASTSEQISKQINFRKGPCK